MGAFNSKVGLEQAQRLVARERKFSSQMMAWGNSDMHQCGVPVNGILPRPKLVKNLDHARIVKVYAGHKHSAALLSDGSIRVWGKNDCGQLGIGRRSEPISSPCSLEQLEQGRRFSHVALGLNHSLFVEETGGVWAAGSNEWGQLGLGTPVASLGSEFQPPASAPTKDVPDAIRSMPVTMINHELDLRLQSIGLQPVPTGDNVAAHLARPVPTIRKEQAVAAANQHQRPSTHGMRVNSHMLAAAAAGIGSINPLLTWNDIVAHEAHWPVKVGRDLCPLLEEFSDGQRVITFAETQFSKHSSGVNASLNISTPREFINLLSALPGTFGSAAVNSTSEDLFQPRDSVAKGSTNLPEAPGSSWKPLHEQTVSKVVAEGSCSAALTMEGHVWMFGVGFGGTFSNGNLVQTEGRRIMGRPSQLIAENGGAVDISMGSNFCVVLTQNGSVVLWGKVAPEGLVCNPSSQHQSFRESYDHRVVPAIRDLVAGRSHVLMSDGSGVWHMRIFQDSIHKTMGSVRRVKFDDSFSGVRGLSAGGSASAVVDLEGKLWMWGLLADTSSGGVVGSPKTATGQVAAPCIGTFQKQPCIVPGLDPVIDVAVGTQHVLALTSTLQ